ncbi:MAG: hypothetical protein K2L92_06395 [Muribaculaceae bacterium]|nr:hypothetical protein [Muribaculaceae bacterium]
MKKLLLLASLISLALNINAREPQEGWKQLGTGTFCDDMFSAISESFLDTWEVEIEESEALPGLYRLVNPFGNGKCPYFENSFNGNDLIIDATDPEHVWIPLQEMGFSAGDWGEFSICCFNGLMIASEVFTLEELIEFECEFGKLAEGRITFPQNEGYRLQPAFSNYLEGTPADGNTHDKFLVTLPSSSGTGSLAIEEDTSIEYYNLQGIRVENPTSGYYIRRQGSKSSRVLLR